MAIVRIIIACHSWVMAASHSSETMPFPIACLPQRFSARFHLSAQIFRVVKLRGKIFKLLTSGKTLFPNNNCHTSISIKISLSRTQFTLFYNRLAPQGISLWHGDGPLLWKGRAPRGRSDGWLGEGGYGVHSLQAGFLWSEIMLG